MPANQQSLEIIYEDDYLLVVCKPVSIHSLSQSAEDDSVASRLNKQRPDLNLEKVDQKDLGLCNRLDFETSGCLLVAKEQEIYEKIRTMFKLNKVSKTYIALVSGTMKNQAVEAEIGSPYRRAKKVRTYPKDKGIKRSSLALTSFEFLEQKSQNSLVKAISSSGKRHQIRAHAAFAGHPLVGDSLYGYKGLELKEDNFPAKFLLHASSLEFIHPVSGKTLYIESELPDYYKFF